MTESVMKKHSDVFGIVIIICLVFPDLRHGGGGKGSCKQTGPWQRPCTIPEGQGDLAKKRKGPFYLRKYEAQPDSFTYSKNPY